ncbi:MAG: carbohydrate binding family 9 domain-containing protein, partial [Gemmatimonadetes bacterium]|nr:carbohydrate binding family 9 domain-containing protein [Gemmatimonadota bacterium]
MSCLPYIVRDSRAALRPTARAGCHVLLAAGLLSLPGQAAAQQANGDNGAPPVLEALPLPTSAAIDLDGRILEDIWQSATPITDFMQQEPVEGGTPSERTEIRVIFDTDHLYIGAILYDDPDGILAYQRQRDAGLNTDDRFMWILDTFLDGRTGYFFEINPAGLMGDGLLGGGGGRGGGGGGGGVSKAWDGIWEARTARREDGWSAEIRIPFRTLNFNPNLDTWGINFQRTIRRRNEEILWRGYRRNEGLWRPVYAGRLSGLRNLSQGLGLEARPSAVATWKDVPANADPTTFPRDISLDVNYSVTSSLRASASINTDFAEVESDQRRVNL